MSRNLIISHRASASADAFTIAKITGHLAAEPAAADTDALIGTFDAQGANSGEMADIVLSGPAEVKLGGTVAAGDMLTADANAHAVSIAAGATKRTIGIALSAGVDGDVIPYNADPGTASVPA